MEMTELIIRLQSVLNDTKTASSLIEDGKEVKSFRQLQGVRTKLVNIIEGLKNELASQNIQNQ